LNSEKKKKSNPLGANLNMAKPKCGYCEEKVAKRYCPSLDKLLCPVCCGTNRLKNISCEDGCRYLDNEEYQQKIRKQKELNAVLAKVPHSEHNDIFKDERAASIAYQFESFFADCYIKGDFNLIDQKVRNALSDVYYLKFKSEQIKPDDFLVVLLQLYEQISNKCDSPDLIETVILRIIISVKNMTGGQFGAYGYLNYLKNNIHPSSFKEHIIEFKDGRTMRYDFPGDVNLPDSERLR
jgi:hypothetical protein